jgi:hypothetical protein
MIKILNLLNILQKETSPNYIRLFLDMNCCCIQLYYTFIIVNFIVVFISNKYFSAEQFNSLCTPKDRDVTVCLELLNLNPQ